LHLLITAAMAEGHQAQRGFFTLAGVATQTHSRSESLPIAEGQHRIKTATLRPGRASQQADLQAQGLLPARRMGTG
jgi:hypothetical protein